MKNTYEHAKCTYVHKDDVNFTQALESFQALAPQLRGYRVVKTDFSRAALKDGWEPHNDQEKWTRDAECAPPPPAARQLQTPRLVLARAHTRSRTHTSAKGARIKLP